MIASVAEAFAVSLLAVIFLAAGTSKLRALDTFEGVVHNFRLLPQSLVRPVAVTLPFVELGLALGLLVSTFRNYAGWLAVGLLGIFTLAVVINLLRGRHEIDCGCFSSELKQTLSWWMVVRNLALGGLAFWIAQGMLADQTTSLVAWLLGTVTAVMVVTLYLSGTIISTVAQDVAARRAMAKQQ